jgi:methyl-accepting chemotaxis protein
LQKSLKEEGTPASQEVSAAIGDDASTALIGLIKYSRYVKAGKSDRALTTLVENIQPALQRLSGHITTYQQAQIASLAAVKQDVAMQQIAVLQQTLAIVAVSALIGCAFSYWIVRSGVTPLQDAKEAAGHMATGDFSKRLNTLRQDEVGQVMAAFNQISSGLTALVSSIRGSADQVHAVAENIAGRTVRLEQHPVGARGGA